MTITVMNDVESLKTLDTEFSLAHTKTMHHAIDIPKIGLTV